jgi:isoleucyl-tRNA synthetase
MVQTSSEWENVVDRIGRWVDFQGAYKTMDKDYMESVWWVFKSLWDAGYVYKGHKAMHICPRCVTPLSNFEVTQGYKELKDLSVITKFPITDETFLKKYCFGKPTSFVAWTTTPWSIPTTMGLAVGPDFTYVLVETGNEQIICVKDRYEYVTNHLEPGSAKVVAELKGAVMDKVSYNHPFENIYGSHPDVVKNKEVYKTHLTNYVSVDDGTGIVTINGAFGEVDYEAAKKIGLPVVVNVNMDGTYTGEMGELAGGPVKPIEDPAKMDVEIMKILQRTNFLWRKEKYTHSYPHCWRCDTPLLNYLTDSWFVRVTEMKEQLLKNNEVINWIPEHIKEGRFGKWLEGARDWAVSRNRYWGTPLPVWESDDGDAICVGSVAELENLSGKKVSDLHKHLIDPIVITKNGKEYRRIPEVLDCWFESGSMPYGQMHYPFENKEKFEASFPAEFIAEGQDQTRGWFYTLHVLATALTLGKKPSIPVKKSEPAFKN